MSRRRLARSRRYAASVRSGMGVAEKKKAHDLLTPRGRSPPKKCQGTPAGQAGNVRAQSDNARTLPSLRLLISFKEPAGVLLWCGAVGKVIRDQTPLHPT